ncbi:hypothetical protein LC087_10890 [Bacillus carboniphilus]|uniref:Exosporium protein C n=1 Tax=Bacillus carboniphilus TaxID=86663 RepID=A0ABY9JQ14_9BACI|nr:hypothetical protein [Bacillus carboniphilus]WLR41412.1 hypothetical protein LC087_10890 [Bacillus carboniphilus]
MATPLHQIQWPLEVFLFPNTTTSANLQVVANGEAEELGANYSARFILSDPSISENFVVMFNVDENPRRLEFNRAGVAVLPDVETNETIAGTFMTTAPVAGFITYQLFEQTRGTVLAERIALFETI